MNTHFSLEPAMPMSKTPKQLAGRRFKALKHATTAFTHLHSIPDDILKDMNLTHSDLQELRRSFKKASLWNSKTFTICPTCYKALKKRKPRKDSKNHSHYKYNICEKTPSYKLGEYNYVIHHSTKLKDAYNFLHTEHPELFI